MAQAACASCQCFLEPKPVPEGAKHMSDGCGICIRFPKTERKRPDEYCFEHKPKRKER